MKASVILPTYNEAGNICELVTKIMAIMPAEWDYEIIVVDDNSPDGTFQKVSAAFAANARVVPVLRTTDRGFAKSIRCGIEQATGEQILVMDTDLTHDPVEIPKLLHVGRIYDMVSGSRFAPGGSMQDTAHYIASMVYNWFMRLMLRTQVQDNLGGFFTMKKAALLSLGMDRIFFGYGDYFFRLIHYAQRAKLTLVEIPAQYHARTTGASKSRFVRMLFSYTGAMWALKNTTRRERSGSEIRA